MTMGPLDFCFRRWRLGASIPATIVCVYLSAGYLAADPPRDYGPRGKATVAAALEWVASFTAQPVGTPSSDVFSPEFFCDGMDRDAYAESFGGAASASRIPNGVRLVYKGVDGELGLTFEDTVTLVVQGAIEDPEPATGVLWVELTADYVYKESWDGGGPGLTETGEQSFVLGFLEDAEEGGMLVVLEGPSSNSATVTQPPNPASRKFILESLTVKQAVVYDSSDGAPARPSLDPVVVEPGEEVRVTAVVASEPLGGAQTVDLDVEVWAYNGSHVSISFWESRPAPAGDGAIKVEDDVLIPSGLRACQCYSLDVWVDTSLGGEIIATEYVRVHFAVPASFHRGDADDNGSVNLTDGVFILNHLFLGGPIPPCMEAANANDDEVLNLTDGVYILNYLFLGGPPPAVPGPAEMPCGRDPPGSDSNLGCDEYTNC